MECYSEISRVEQAGGWAQVITGKHTRNIFQDKILCTPENRTCTPMKKKTKQKRNNQLKWLCTRYYKSTEDLLTNILRYLLI